MKNCSKCKNLKDYSAFSPAKRTPSGRASYCKECMSTWMREHRNKNLAACRQREKIRRAAHPVSYERNTHLKKKFGITEDDFDKKSSSQQHACAICLNPETATRRGKIKHMAVDHDHGTGRIRALLCQRCNQALGLMRESFDAALSLAKYIQHHNNVI